MTPPDDAAHALDAAEPWLLPTRDGLDPGSDQHLVGLPTGTLLAGKVARDGVTMYPDGQSGTVVTVNPLAATRGTQILVTLTRAESPTHYRFPVSVPTDGTLTLTEDGGAQVVFSDGTVAMTIQAPWAVDARERSIPTHFEVVGQDLVQVVQHRATDTAYPVVADPTVFGCDWHTHTCVKFTKSETKKIAKKYAGPQSGLGPFIGAFCGLIPHVIAKAVCAGLVGVIGWKLGASFKSAAKSGKCVEVHFSRGVGPTFPWWKTEGC